MRTVAFDLVWTLLVAMLVYFVGRLLVARVGVLRGLNIPAPVVGGGLVAIVLALVDGLLHVKAGFDLAPKDTLLLMFFTTVGLAADARLLLRGGTRLAVFLGVSAVLIVVQNVVGIGATRVLDLHPVVGLLGGSITLVGGHGTGAAYAARLGETMNLQGAMELTMACATAGLVIGAVVGGPVAEYLLKRHRLTSAAAAAAEPGPGTAGDEADDPVTAQSLIATLFVVLLCLAVGKVLAGLAAGTGFILPDFVFALMTMRLLDLANLAGPLLMILAAQTVVIVLFAVLVTFRVMGRGYDAAIMAAGQIGFGMSSTACALAIMKSVTERYGPSPLAFLIVPMVGAFFIDITNAVIVQAYLALPLFGF